MDNTKTSNEKNDSFNKLPFGRADVIRKNTPLWQARFADRFTSTSKQTAMYCIEHTDAKGNSIYDSYNQWRYFAYDEDECDKVLAHLWEEFGERGIVAVSPLYAGPTFYRAKLNADMCEEFKDCNVSQKVMENIKATYWEGDIGMSELLLNPEYASLSDEHIDELLTWAGEDEYCNAEDIREGQALVMEQELEEEQER